MRRGWICLWRKSIDSGMLQNPELWAFWCWCLLKATRQKIKQQVGHQLVHLEPGQFVFGRDKAAYELKQSEWTIRRLLKTLEASNNLAIETTNKFSIITILNWHTYQFPESEDHQQNPKQMTLNSPSSALKQEILKKTERDVPLKISPEILEFSENFHKHQQEQHPTLVRAVTKKKIRDGAVAVHQLIKQGHDFEAAIKPALRWGVMDDFWSRQLLSLSRLTRKSKNGEIKFVNLLAQYEQSSNSGVLKEQRKGIESLLPL